MRTVVIFSILSALTLSHVLMWIKELNDESPTCTLEDSSDKIDFNILSSERYSLPRSTIFGGCISGWIIFTKSPVTPEKDVIRYFEV